MAQLFYPDLAFNAAVRPGVRALRLGRTIPANHRLRRLDRALDLAARDVLVDRLRAVQRAEAIPVLYVTHSPPEAIALGSRLFRLEHGTIVDQGAPLDVLTRSRPGTAARLEGIRNILPATAVGPTADGRATMAAVIGDSGNLASIRLHEALGFRHAGVLKDMAFKHGRWLDVVFMQRELAGRPQPVCSSSQPETER